MESTLICGCPTVTLTLPLTEPQKPGANSKSFPHIDIFGITSFASPINVAPFTGLVNLPFFIN